MICHFQKPPTQRKTDTKKHITNTNERDKAQIGRMNSHDHNGQEEYSDKGSLVYSYSIYTLD